jgi:hypothetical protein
MDATEVVPPANRRRRFIRFRSNTSKLASFFRATESVAGAFNTSGLAPGFFILISAVDLTADERG